MKTTPSLMHLSTKRVKLAVGRRLPGGFVVYAGSRAAADTTPSIPRAFAQLRDALVSAKVIVPSDDGQMVFAQDFIFSSSSTAASVVLGKSANGNDEWKPMA